MIEDKTRNKNNKEFLKCPPFAWIQSYCPVTFGSPCIFLR